MKKIALIAASLAILATPALAAGDKTTGSAPAEAKFSTVQKDEMFSSKLKGLSVTIRRMNWSARSPILRSRTTRLMR